ncbi:MAG: hypothetical protein K0R61_3055 [Microvirga sp.]|nr:hypothetical protein [Microvirga sp.]MDF2972605.1 hypothetical protein [Microvirga sp.]
MQTEQTEQTGRTKREPNPNRVAAGRRTWERRQHKKAEAARLASRDRAASFAEQAIAVFEALEQCANGNDETPTEPLAEAAQQRCVDPTNTFEGVLKEEDVVRAEPATGNGPSAREELADAFEGVFDAADVDFSKKAEAEPSNGADGEGHEPFLRKPAYTVLDAVLVVRDALQRGDLELVDEDGRLAFYAVTTFVRRQRIA